MKIRIKEAENFAGVALSVTGSALGLPGEEYVVPDEEGKALCDGGLAEPVAEPEKGTEKRAAKKDKEEES